MSFPPEVGGLGANRYVFSVRAPKTRRMRARRRKMATFPIKLVFQRKKGVFGPFPWGEKAIFY